MVFGFDTITPGVLSSAFDVLHKSDPAQSDVQMMDMQRNQT